ncbi:hypothetical protein [Myroides odoratus]|uniref:hypothetical protein n=1 Tax=Myroides odoratus TaxID=256 RepID=UPI00216975C4|nr:hypothetical protein [Myroides odoratus]MCS4239886.1 UDP-3-O-[3-hydroxymyristoyl] glucosamine N-acyltransferase [Myroides odoratus]
MANKYQLTEESMDYKGHTLWRIQNMITGEMGGWLEGYNNLSQEEGCMVWEEAKVYGNAFIDNEATISGNATISDNATVSGHVSVLGNAEVYGDAILSGFCSIIGSAKVYGHALVQDYAIIDRNAEVYDEARVGNTTIVTDNTQVYGKAKIQGMASIRGQAKVYENAIVRDRAIVFENAQVYGNAKVGGSTFIMGNAQIHGNAIIKGNEIIGGDADIYEYNYTWEDIASITSLKIYANSQNHVKQESIYANGNQQVEIEVILEAIDEDGNSFQLDEQEIYNHMQFVDHENIPFGNRFEYSDEAGEYAISTRQHSSTFTADGTSSRGLFYLATEEEMGEIKLCVSCVIYVVIQGVPTEVEYTTAVLNNNGNVDPDYVVLKVLDKRVFTLQDIRINTIELVKPDSYNSLLMKYYIDFSDNSGATISQVENTDDNWFHYKQKGNYKAFATTTDSAVEADSGALFTAVFGITNNWTITVTSTNHDMPGLCLWTYRVWHGALWSFYEWNEPLFFKLYDQYGNDVKIEVIALNDAVLQFEVV